MADKKISQLTGATTPLAGTEVLPIVQGGTTVKVSIDNLTAGKAVAASQLTIENNSSSSAVRITQTGAGNALLVEDSSNPDATPFVVDNNGNVGVGATPSAWQPSSYRAVQFPAGVSLFGEIGTPSAIMVTNAYLDAAYSFTYTTSAAASYYQQRAGEHKWYTAPVGVAGNAVSFTQVMGISASGNITANAGNFVVGTAGKGIDFSANAHAAGKTSELLNWYEEGTWTGVLTCGTSGTITLNASFQTGSYTRIGRLVTVTGLFLVDSVSSPVGVLYLTGLPFAISNGGNFARTAASVCAFDLAATATTSIVGRGLSGESQIQIYKYAAGAISNLAGDVVSGSQFYVSMTYITA